MSTNITFHKGVCFHVSLARVSQHAVCLPGSVDATERSELLNQKGVTIWLTGLSASGKVCTASVVR